MRRTSTLSAAESLALKEIAADFEKIGLGATSEQLLLAVETRPDIPPEARAGLAGKIRRMHQEQQHYSVTVGRLNQGNLSRAQTVLLEAVRRRFQNSQAGGVGKTSLDLLNVFKAMRRPSIGGIPGIPPETVLEGLIEKIESFHAGKTTK